MAAGPARRETPIEADHAAGDVADHGVEAVAMRCDMAMRASRNAAAPDQPFALALRHA